METKWENYGDKNFWEYGQLVRRHWAEKQDEYDVIVCQPSDKNGKYLVACCYVDITDTWIDKKAVMEFSDTKGLVNETDKIAFALGCIAYYGVHNFQPQFPNNMYVGNVDNWLVTQKEAYEWLHDFGLSEFVSSPSIDSEVA